MQELERRLQREFREVAHGAAHFLERGAAGQVARHHAQQHALAQAPQPALQRGFVRRRGAGERLRHFGAPERRCGDELGGELGARREEPRGVARIGNFLNRLRHLPLEWLV